MKSFRPTSLIAGLPAAVLVAVACGLPLAWLACTVASNPVVWNDLNLSSFRLSLLGRTLGYNACVAILATAMALPAAIVLGRGRGVAAKILWCVLPAALLMPSLAYAYGWSQFVRLNRDLFAACGMTFVPGGLADVARCVWTLAAWFWPVPAGIVGLALRRMDVSTQQQALIEGVLWRITLRQLLAPILAAAAVVTLLATQEFAVYEPSGISVVATEVRMVFETAAFSSLPHDGALPDQSARAAAAVATALPLLAITVLLAAGAMLAAWRQAPAGSVTAGDWPRALSAPAWTYVASGVLVAVTLGTPVVSLVLSHKGPFDAGRIWTQFSPELMGTLVLAAGAGLLAMVVAMSAAAGWSRGLLALAGVSFLIGGQLLAIALIRICNRPGLEWAYDSFPVPVIAYLGRFAWLPLAAARATRWGSWTELREMSAIDGAGRLRTARHVVWPLAWPSLAAAGLLVGALTVNEVPATVLLRPQNPQVLTTLVMSWVHIANYDSMIEASLLMMAVVVIPATAAVALAAVAMRQAAEARRRREV